MTFFARTIPILALILGSASAGTTTTWTIYANDACTEICPFGSVEACSTTIDTTKDCNQNLESSQSDVACSATKVTYINYPNTGTNSGSEGCPSDGQSFTNEIAVGECVEFPGPVTTWKMIEADTYDCGDDSNNENPTTAPAPTVSPVADTPAPTASPVGADTPAPTVSPTLSPVASPSSSSCSDSTYRFRLAWNGSNISRYCTWVANKQTVNRCAVDGVSEMCPNTCGTCSTCADSYNRIKFEYNDKMITRSCTWTANKQTVLRCAITGMTDTCRATCGQC